MRQRILAKDPLGNKVFLEEYADDYGIRHTDLNTDGRVLLTPVFAEELARKLYEWARKKKGKK